MMVARMTPHPIRTSNFCPCHDFEGADVSRALDAGAGTVAQIFRHIGVCAKCGDCVPKIRDMLRESQSAKQIHPTQPKENKMSARMKVKIAIMMEDGDKLEYESHVTGTDLESAKAEAEGRMKAAITLLGARVGALQADRVKIETM